jgi:hypothetical protein
LAESASSGDFARRRIGRPSSSLLAACEFCPGVRDDAWARFCAPAGNGGRSRVSAARSISLGVAALRQRTDCAVKLPSSSELDSTLTRSPSAKEVASASAPFFCTEVAVVIRYQMIRWSSDSITICPAVARRTMPSVKVVGAAFELRPVFLRSGCGCSLPRPR